MPRRRPVGKPIGFVEVEVRRSDDARCEPEEIGEIVVRGPNVTTGYWRRPEATAAASLAGGWFRTGDGGAVDEDGYLSLAGRPTDAIALPEGRVFPAEIERLLYGAPGIADSAVVYVDGGVVLAVVPVPGEPVTLAAVRRIFGARLPHWKLPTAITLVPAIPRNAAGKILRDRVRHLVVGGAPT